MRLAKCAWNLTPGLRPSPLRIGGEGKRNSGYPSPSIRRGGRGVRFGFTQMTQVPQITGKFPIGAVREPPLQKTHDHLDRLPLAVDGMDAPGQRRNLSEKNGDHVAPQDGHEKKHGHVGHLPPLGGFGRFYRLSGMAKEGGQEQRVGHVEGREKKMIALITLITLTPSPGDPLGRGRGGRPRSVRWDQPGSAFPLPADAGRGWGGVCPPKKNSWPSWPPSSFRRFGRV